MVTDKAKSTIRKLLPYIAVFLAICVVWIIATHPLKQSIGPLFGTIFCVIPYKLIFMLRYKCLSMFNEKDRIQLIDYVDKQKRIAWWKKCALLLYIFIGQMIVKDLLNLWSTFSR